MKKIIFSLVIFILALGFQPVCAENAKVTQKTPNAFLSATTSKTSPKPIDDFVGHFDNKIKIVFSDIDGTILPFKKGNYSEPAPESARLAVQKLHKAQIPLVLTTGRGREEAIEIAKKIGNENAYIITQQGAIISDSKGRIVYKDIIDSTDLKKILNEIQKYLKEQNLHSKVVVSAEDKSYAFEEVILPYNWKKINIVKSFDNMSKLNVVKICIYEPDPKNIKLLQSHMKSVFPSYNIVLSTHCYCDISSASVNKGKAIKVLADKLGIDLKNAVTLGDAENDISMLDQIKNSGGAAIAVGNALPVVQEHANFVTSTVYEGGFAKAVDKILENNAVLKVTK